MDVELSPDQLTAGMGRQLQKKKPVNPFVDFRPQLYKRLTFRQNGAQATGIDPSLGGRTGLGESIEEAITNKDHMLNYLFTNGLIKQAEYNLAWYVVRDPESAARQENSRVLLVKIFRKLLGFVLNDPQNYMRSRQMLNQSISSQTGVEIELVNVLAEACISLSKKKKKLNTSNADNRQIGTDSLLQIYRSATPGQ